MSLSRLGVLAALACVLAFSLPAASAEDPLLDQALSLIKSQEFKKAYELLEPLESERAGQVDYDYLLGVAAVESGNVTRGVFALERVLANQPNHVQARAEIARAYFRLGENETAKMEFQHVLKQSPPEDAKETINRFLSAIDKNLGLATRYRAFLDIGIGHDTNVNSATAAGTVAVPIFGGAIFNLSSNAQELSSNFISVAGGVSFSTPVSQNFSLFGSVAGNKKLNWAQEQFNTDSLDFNFGAHYKKGLNAYSLTLQDGSYYVDGERFRHAYGFTGQWQRTINENNQLSTFLQTSRLEYPGQEIRNVDRYVLGAGWGHAFGGDKAPVLFMSAYLGTEEERETNVPFFGNDLYGLRFGGQVTVNPKTVAYASASYEFRDYGGDDPLFLTTREDDQYDFAIGMRYLPGYNWTIRPQISYIKNDSNILINEYDRTMVSINFRHDFGW